MLSMKYIEFPIRVKLCESNSWPSLAMRAVAATAFVEAEGLFVTRRKDLSVLGRQLTLVVC